jgi:hypothetical protein
MGFSLITSCLILTSAALKLRRVLGILIIASLEVSINLCVQVRVLVRFQGLWLGISDAKVTLRPD